jgi:hypothetical protein
MSFATTMLTYTFNRGKVCPNDGNQDGDCRHASRWKLCRKPSPARERCFAIADPSEPAFVRDAPKP